MKTVILQRTHTGDTGTFGTLYIDGYFFGYTGELPMTGGNPDIPNERCKDCIPAGTYTVVPRRSAKFGSTYEVTGVPNRSAILIHTGNTCGNVAKGYKSDVEGCILLGNSRGKLYGQDAVLQSGVAMRKFRELMGNQPFTLVVKNP